MKWSINAIDKRNIARIPRLLRCSPVPDRSTANVFCLAARPSSKAEWWRLRRSLERVPTLPHGPQGVNGCAFCVTICGMLSNPSAPAELLAVGRLGIKASVKPGELSGGMKCRLSLGQALSSLKSWRQQNQA